MGTTASIAMIELECPFVSESTLDATMATEPDEYHLTHPRYFSALIGRLVSQITSALSIHRPMRPSECPLFPPILIVPFLFPRPLRFAHFQPFVRLR